MPLKIVTLILLVTMRAQAADPQVVRLWPGDPPATQLYDSSDHVTPRKQGGLNLAHVLHPSLAVYPPPPGPATRRVQPRPAAIICAGGAYAKMVITVEGTNVAEALKAHGFVGFVLRYRLPDGHPPAARQLPVPQQDVLRAIQTVRSRAAEWDVDPTRIGVIGFSAGGHLAAAAATLFDEADGLSAKAGGDSISKTSARPDFAVLVYPVITMDAKVTHADSRRALIGNAPDAETIERFSAEKRVTPQTPPLMIVTAEDDTVVPPANSLLMAGAAAEQRVPCTLVLLKSGGHGFSLGQPEDDSARWFDLMIAWMRMRRLMD
jgi:acetyl esterase/lipase